MNITLIGTNHKTAPIEVREKFYLSELEQDLLISELKSDPRLIEGFVVSTCNRTEIYICTIDDTLSIDEIVDQIVAIKKNPNLKSLTSHFYKSLNDEAIRHLFRVSAGLDSLVLGERQILGQIKSAFDRSIAKGFFGKYMNILSNLAIRTGKKAQNDTKIGYGGSSVSWAAITKAEANLGDLSDKSVLIIGAGKMSKLAVGQIFNKGFKKLYIMNRTEKHAREIADRYCGEIVPFCDIKEILHEIDLCICSVGAPHYVLEKTTVERVMKKKYGMLMLIDISMPRNIDPKISELDNVKLYSIDDLDNIVEKNMLIRKNAVNDVNDIIEEKFNQFFHKLSKLSKTPDDLIATN